SAAGHWRRDHGRRCNTLVVHQSQILPDVQSAIPKRTELTQIAVFGYQVDIRAVGGNAHAVVITLREIEDRARQKVGWIRDVGNGNAVHELDVGRQREVPGENNVLQESAKVRVQDV